MLGRADKVWADKDNSRIIGGKGDKKVLQSRIDQIKRAINTTTSDFDKEKLQERLAKLSGGVAVINVGAATEVEMKEKKERVIDAVAATKAALEEGIVPGGEVALLDISGRMSPKNLDDANAARDEIIGFEILRQAMEAPFIKLVENAGLDSGQLIARAREVSAHGQGFNILKIDSVENAQPVDMYKEGIIDPVKVVRSAVENAVSVAIMILTTEALVVDDPEEKKNTPPMPPGGMDY
jgi:chaperonin GroEL